MRLPCVVEAQYANESTDAIAADRYAFVRSNATSELFLRPGHYRLRAWGGDGKTISQRTITVSQPRMDKSSKER
jgi:hypothetical protein